tara:strand:+ start:173 stop:670 length:498 start_codon:yes stop_codon:yes gene_type:complete
MTIEIERRFLLRNDEWKKFVIDKTFIIQGYFKTDSKDWTMRIRSENKKFKITLKKHIKNFTSHEFEYEIPSKDGETILSTLSDKVVKERFYLVFEQKNWVVDIFKEKNYPLKIAEIELNNEEEQISIPNFLSNEITGFKNFSNSQLARLPISKWNKQDKRTFFKN